MASLSPVLPNQAPEDPPVGEGFPGWSGIAITGEVEPTRGSI
jgi:hypothetical protein